MPRKRPFNSKTGGVRTQPPGTPLNIFKTHQAPFAFSPDNFSGVGEMVFRCLAGGGAMMFGYSAKTGTMSVTIFMDESRQAAYARTEDELTSIMDAVFSYFPDLEEYEMTLTPQEMEAMENVVESQQKPLHARNGHLHAIE